MKQGQSLWTIFALVCSWSVTPGVVTAQTFYQWRMTSPQTNHFTVPANTLCEITEFHAAWNNNQIAWVWLLYPEQTNQFINWLGLSSPISQVASAGSALGPCGVEIASTSTNLIVLTLKTSPVNTAPPPTLVAPAGSVAHLTVETSTNLNDWQTITNTTWPRSESHRFFRTRLETEK